jgi:hypothetical protein
MSSRLQIFGASPTVRLERFQLLRENCIIKGKRLSTNYEIFFVSLNPNIRSSLHVFDHTIKPIRLYGSEIWGYFNPFKKKLIFDHSPIAEAFNLKSEKLHLKFCKFVLGVNRKTTNLATLSELGMFPLQFDVIKSMIRYWYRLENLNSSFPLLNHTYLES